MTDPAAPPHPSDAPHVHEGAGAAEGSGPAAGASQTMPTRKPSTLLPILGLLLAGYGILVLTQVLPHDAPLAGAVSLVLGIVLLWRRVPRLALTRRGLVLGLGLAIVAGVLGYQLVRSNGIGIVEACMLGYGALLCVASFHLARKVGSTDVGSLVAWSFPLLMAPLALFAANGAISSPQTGAAATPIVALVVVQPTAWALRLVGTPVDVLGNNLLLETPRGGLSLGVGLVCAGLYPIVLFLGLVGLHAWRSRMPPRAMALCIGLGIAGLWAMNILRLVLLARIGIAYGAGALQEWHANMGWILFALFMAGFWALVLRRLEPKAA